VSNESIEFKRRAIQEAQEEYNSLIEKLREHEQIKARLSQLDAFINTGKALWGIEVKPAGKTEAAAPTSLFPDDNTQPLTHLKSVKKIIADAGRALSLSELVEEYHKRKWKLSEVNGREVLRGIVIRNSKEFIKAFRGKEAYYELAV